MKYVLGIDFGGGASKATLLSEAGEIVATNTVEYPTLYPAPRYVEQDPMDWYRAAVSNIREVKARGAMTIVICDDNADIDREAADYLIRVPQLSEMLMPMVATVPMQLLAYYTSVNKGNDVDKPRNLAKSVTVE